ncbi:MULTISPECIES: primosomal protein N' [Brevibacterium]|uniref:Replication restart DNA helicase PriA n=2 Tax=Brevibacterium antiquum TaxID=234835 RepID=A0A2H1HN44_9MICO|nr:MULTISPECIES: primosomal protein N' [Brevibacterium]SMX64314.1 replication restart DNA helicase PriA [Brevibacterium antiquum CNRZ 918]SMX65042.1 replication restart DNA helicase PriA [Brevibacterium antiquum]HCG57335.1 primosomal protein N' [Brevibacterium sp.]
MDEPLPIDTGTSAIGQVPLAAEDPVAHVLIDHPVPHLARAFDYAVPEKFADTARPGVRVRVKFAGKLRDGFLLERVESSEHIGPLATIERITSPVVVLTPELLRLGSATARRYAGTLSDVLRLAIPPRHARAEKAVLKTEKTLQHNASSSSAARDGDNASAATEDTTAGSEDTTAGSEVVTAHHESARTADTIERLGEWVVTESRRDREDDFPAAEHPRMALTCVPGPTPGLSWITAGLEAARATLAAGESVLWLVPDHRELAVLSASLDASADIPSYSVLSADQSPEQRWTAWLRGLLGHTRVTIGTRAAAFAPVADLGLIICFDDSNSNYLDQHAPYPHAREVCLLRSTIDTTGLLFVSTDRSAEIQRLVEVGWLHDATPIGPERREGAPRVFVPDEERDPFAWQRIPSRAWQLMRGALRPGAKDTNAVGPVLVQVPRAGYYPVFACARCQEVARCPQCSATLTTQSEVGPFACRSCGFHSDSFSCGRCNSNQVRSIVRGRGRTVEELRKAMPGIEILESGGDDIPVAIDDSPRIVVATTGAEPYTLGGYACAILLDSLWPGPWMRSTDEGVSRRLRAAVLVRSRTAGGVVYLGDTDETIRSTVTTFDPVTTMSRALSDRLELGFPPYRRIVELTGAGADIDAIITTVSELTELIRDSEGDDQKAVAAYPIAAGDAVGEALAHVTASRSAKKLPQVRIRIDDPRSL